MKVFARSLCNTSNLIINNPMTRSICSSYVSGNLYRTAHISTLHHLASQCRAFLSSISWSRLHIRPGCTIQHCSPPQHSTTALHHALRHSTPPQHPTTFHHSTPPYSTTALRRTSQKLSATIHHSSPPHSTAVLHHTPPYSTTVRWLALIYAYIYAYI